MSKKKAKRAAKKVTSRKMRTIPNMIGFDLPIGYGITHVAAEKLDDGVYVQSSDYDGSMVLSPKHAIQFGEKLVEWGKALSRKGAGK